jgi:predicted GIY-YIG superfamily endonuclease
MLRDKLRARLAEPGPPDYQALASEILGIKNTPPELARRLVQQALVVEDRRDEWRRIGERICRDAPPTPGVYVLRDATGAALYVGKAVNLRRRLRAHFAERRWRHVKAEMSRAADAEWREVGSELEALLREAELIRELQPTVNVQIGAPDLSTRGVPGAILRDVIVVVPSVEEDSAELVAARTAGAWLVQRTRRDGADLAVHTTRLWRFFNAAIGPRREPAPLAPIVYSWLAGRGASATRLDPHASASPRVLRTRLAALLKDDRLFLERLDQR